MNLKVMSKTNMSAWINHLADQYRVIAPMAAIGQFVFGEINNAEEVSLDYKTSVLPPKKALLPQYEDLVQFDCQSHFVEPVYDSQSTVLLGVHTCDLHAIKLLDYVFCTGYLDHHYQVRRENTTLISIECLVPCTEYAFCKDMGTLYALEGYDLHLMDLGDVYGIQVGSQRGEQLLGGFTNPDHASERDHGRYYRAMQAKWSRFTHRLDPDINELPKLLKAGENSPLWHEIERRCLGCGMCTIVCPTCYCFDVLDEVDLSLSAGRRYRKWDSCQFNQFATVAGGHNFRQGLSSRQRHRFLRKYSYQSIAPGLLGCVGCGRCASTCLVNINPVDVLNKLHISQHASTKVKEVTYP
jgi:ferredoxin